MELCFVMMLLGAIVVIAGFLGTLKMRTYSANQSVVLLWTTVTGLSIASFGASIGSILLGCTNHF